MNNKDLSNQIRNLSVEHVTELSEAMTTASLLFEYEHAWRYIFKNKMFKYKTGLKHRIYKQLSQMSGEQMNKMSGNLSNVESMK